MEQDFEQFCFTTVGRAYLKVMHTEPDTQLLFNDIKSNYNEELDLFLWVPDEFAEFLIRLFVFVEDLSQAFETKSSDCKVYVETSHVIYGPHNVGHCDEHDGVICTTVENVGTVIEEILMIFGLNYYNERKQHIIKVSEVDKITETTCCVCLESLCTSEYSTVQLSVCKHIFCESCISNWIVRNKNCPLCRTII